MTICKCPGRKAFLQAGVVISLVQSKGLFFFFFPCWPGFPLTRGGGLLTGMGEPGKGEEGSLGFQAKRGGGRKEGAVPFSRPGFPSVAGASPETWSGCFSSVSTGGSKPAEGCRWALAPGCPAPSVEKRRGAPPRELEVTEHRASARDLGV